ncbi:ATP-binding cassette domain-containing protein [Fodinicola feengrottensis]|uniref:ATP-binding cassette domain-containing protein n=1 Tax=Fodinicola feengrottensis TaxID=435914 RepID=UPI0013D071A6|nr:ATP-binding cassette domain-containing protein [Fodinicola feengrottensis]
MTSDGLVIENPASGERIVIRRTAAETGGDLLAWELFLAPGGRVPSSHAHPEQEERFELLAGRLRFRVGFRTVVAGPGDVVVVRPGQVHGFVNTGGETARVLVETRPALQMQELLETAAALVCANRRLPRLFDLLLFMHEFRARGSGALHTSFGACVRTTVGVARPARWPRCSLSPSSVAFAAAGMTDAIEVRELVKHYRGAAGNAVDGVSFDVPDGQFFFCLLGPNGAGKTTTLSVLTTLLAPTSGQVRVAGLDLAAEQSKVRQRVGIVCQQPSLDPNLTAEENLRLHALFCTDSIRGGRFTGLCRARTAGR